MIDRLRNRQRITGWTPVVAPPRDAANDAPRRRRPGRAVVGCVAHVLLRFALMPVTEWLLAACELLWRAAAWSQKPSNEGPEARRQTSEAREIATEVAINACEYEFNVQGVTEFEDCYLVIKNTSSRVAARRTLQALVTALTTGRLRIEV